MGILLNFYLQKSRGKLLLRLKVLNDVELKRLT